MTWQNPELLWLLCLLPIAAVLRARRGARAAVVYSSVDIARRAGKTAKSRIGGVLTAFRFLAAGALIVALARPQVVDTKSHTQASGVDLVLAVDVSSSMNALDMNVAGQPSDRLEAVKAVVKRFIEARPNDRIGLVAFAGAPYLVSPPTLDHAWLLENLARLQTDMVEDGTAIGSGLAASVNRLKDALGKSKTVILLTDGVNNAGKVQPSLAAEAAAAEGVKVYTIGVGSEGKAMMPVTDERGRQRLILADVDVDEPTLRSIADKTGGRFFRATDTESLQRVYSDIDAMEKTTRTVHTETKYQERFAWLAMLGLSFVGLELAANFGLRRRIP